MVPDARCEVETRCDVVRPAVHRITNVVVTAPQLSPIGHSNRAHVVIPVTVMRPGNQSELVAHHLLKAKQ